MKITLVAPLGLLIGTTLASPLPKSKSISTTTISTSNPPGITLAPGSGGISLCLTFGINCPKKVTSRIANAADSDLVKRPVGPVCPPGSTYNGHRCVGSKVRRDPEPHFHPVGPETPPPAPANVVKRDPEPVAEPVFGTTPRCSNNKKLCSDVNGKVKREPDPEPQGLPVGPAKVPSSTFPAATPIPSTKTTKHPKHSATPASLAEREAETGPEPLISLLPSPVGPESAPLPIPTTKSSKHHKKSCAPSPSGLYQVVKREAVAEPEPLISILPSPVGPHTAGSPTSTPMAKSDRIPKRDPEAAPEPLISLLPSPVGPQTGASPTSSPKSTKSHKAAAAATAEILDKPDPIPNPGPIKRIVPSPLPSGTTSGVHYTANGKMCTDDALDKVKRDPEADPEPLISLLPSPVGPHTAASPTSTSKTTKTHKAAAVATAETLEKRNPEAEPEPIISPGGTKPHCSANGKICSNTDATVKRDPNPVPEPEPIISPGGTKPHCSANGKICSKTVDTVKRDAEAMSEPRSPATLTKREPEANPGPQPIKPIVPSPRPSGK